MFELVKASRCLPLPASVTTEAWMLAFLNAVPALEEPLPALAIAVFKAATSVPVSLTPDRLTVTFTRLESEKPAPRK